MGIQVTEVSQGKQPWEKEFIDINFDGKLASEMGFLVTNDGMYQQNIYTDFENEVSTVNGVDGQYFWGTIYSPKVIDYTLSTDEITEAQLNAVKYWLRPGRYGKLIECTYANRYCYCRIGEVPQFEFIPFAKNSTFNGISYKERIYKGSITVQFVLDTPWYYAEKQYINEITNDANGKQNIVEMFQDNLPLLSSYNDASEKLSCVIGKNTLLVTKQGDNETAEYIVSVDNEHLFSSDEVIKCFNPSDLYSKPKITISIPQNDFFSEIIEDYFAIFYDSISGPKDSNDLIYTYNSIFQSDSKPINTVGFTKSAIAEPLYYTSPGVVYLANRAIQIAKNYSESTSVHSLVELEERLRNEITDYDLLSWIIFIFNCWVNGKAIPNSYDNNETIEESSYYNSNNGLLQDEWLDAFKTGVQNFFKDFGDAPESFELIIDSANSNAIFKYHYNVGNIGIVNNEATYSISKITQAEKNCGEIMLTSYLKLAGQDKIDQTGKINTCHALRFYRGINDDLPNGVKIKVEYEYQYA